MVIPAHEDFGTRSKRNDVEEKLCFENFLKVTEDSHEDNLLEDSFDFDPDNLPNFISEEDRIFNSKARFSSDSILPSKALRTGMFAFCSPHFRAI